MLIGGIYRQCVELRRIRVRFLDRSQIRCVAGSRRPPHKPIPVSGTMSRHCRDRCETTKATETSVSLFRPPLDQRGRIQKKWGTLESVPHGIVCRQGEPMPRCQERPDVRFQRSLANEPEHGLPTGEYVLLSLPVSHQPVRGFEEPPPHSGRNER